MDISHSDIKAPCQPVIWYLVWVRDQQAVHSMTVSEALALLHPVLLKWPTALPVCPHVCPSGPGPDPLFVALDWLGLSFALQLKSAALPSDPDCSSSSRSSLLALLCFVLLWTVSFSPPLELYCTLFNFHSLCNHICKQVYRYIFHVLDDMRANISN